MKTVYKYPLVIADVQTVKMPLDATILSAAFQDGTLMVWAEVEPQSAREEKTFVICGTGYELKAPYGKLKFIDTVFNGPLVYHVYEIVSGWY